MRPVRLLSTLAVVGAFAFIASACGSGGGDPEGDVRVTLSDYSIEVSTTTVPAGETEFVATNEGPSTHEYEIFSVPDDAKADDLFVNGSTADTEAAGLELVDEVEDVAPSTSAKLTVSLDPGTYALICNLPDHYGKGMHATFTVE